MSDLVELYLRATRLDYRTRAVDDGTKVRYEALYKDCLFQLDLGSDHNLLGFVVIDTVDAKVENVVLGARDVTVYDCAVGRNLNQLTQFTFDRAPPAAVQRWALRRLSVALLSLGAMWPALCAHHLAARPSSSPTPRPGTAPSGRSTPGEAVAGAATAVARSVDVQEFFVIAHESVHSALRRGSLPGKMVESAFRLVEDAVQAAESTRTAPTTRDVVQAVVRDEVDAINSGSDMFHIDAAQEQALYEERSRQYPLPTYVGSWVEDRPHLIEELVCDLIATDMTLKQFDDQMAPLDILGAVLFGFHAHGTAESIRDFAWQLAHGTPNPDYSAVLGSRTTVWRTMAPDVWGHHGNTAPDVMRRRFTDLTEAASAVVGNQIRYTLRADFGARLAKTKEPESLPADVVVDVVLNGVDLTGP